MPNAEENSPELLAKLGGDARVLALLKIALVAYTHLPHGMYNLTTGKPTRDGIIAAIEAFGIPAKRIPWERFPRRFHKNLPKLQLFKQDLTDAEIEEHWVDLITSQPPDPAKRRRKSAHTEAL